MTVHLFEPGGTGGVLQYVVALSDLLGEQGEDVVLHTADDAEFEPTHATTCRCFSWERKRRLPSAVRRSLIVGKYLGRTVPHLARAVGRTDLLHVQGRFKPGLLLLPMLLAKLRGARVVYSPHILFEREGGVMSALSLRAQIKVSDAVLLFTEDDRARVSRLGREALYTPLVMPLPQRSSSRIAEWRHEWGVEDSDRRVLLFAGQLRPDKRPDLAIRAAAQLPAATWKLAVIGEDKGSESTMRELAGSLDLDVAWHARYVEPMDFAAAVKAADVVICPYDIASQSGVLALAHQLETPSVAREVGGLGDLATVAISTESPAALAAECERVAEHPAPGDPGWRSAAVRSHLRAYGRP